MTMRAEWIILADAAEVVNSKLYLMGGGWDRLIVNQPFPVQQPVALAVSFEVDWNETNVRRPVELRIEDEDGRQLARVNAQIEAGRPAGITPGQSQRVQMAFRLPLRFEKPGDFAVTAWIEDELAGRTRFSVAEGRQSPRGRRRRPDA
jgi:hypothetical protein